MENEKRVYCLYRVSTVGQVEKDDIPMQKQYCREFVSNHPDWHIEKELYEKGISGFKKSAKERDAIQEIQREAVQGKFEVLLVYMFDRRLYPIRLSVGQTGPDEQAQPGSL